MTQILIVDDDTDLRDQTAGYLAEHGYAPMAVAPDRLRERNMLSGSIGLELRCSARTNRTPLMMPAASRAIAGATTVAGSGSIVAVAQISGSTPIGQGDQAMDPGDRGMGQAPRVAR